MHLGLSFSDSDVSSFTPLVVLELADDTKAEAITWLLNRIREKQQNGGETPGMLHLGKEVDRNLTFSEISTCLLKLSVWSLFFVFWGLCQCYSTTLTHQTRTLPFTGVRNIDYQILLVEETQVQSYSVHIACTDNKERLCAILTAQCSIY